jgi:hypothetical protein
MSQPGRSLSRNPLILAAGILLIISGVLGVIGFLRFLGGGVGAVEVLYLLIGLIVAALSIYAGWLIANQQERGRSLGLTLAVIGVVFALISVVQGGGVLIVNLLIDAFVIVVLVTQAKEFA